MANKHHFVPRFYLRRFGTDEDKNVTDRNRIGLYHWPTGRYVLNAPIAGQCQRHRYYGDKEAALAELETWLAPAVHRLADRGQLPGISADDMDLIHYFILLQMDRTEKRFVETVEAHRATARAAYGHDGLVPLVEASPLDLTFREHRLKTTLIASALRRQKFLQDLESVILWAPRDERFVVSDAPVVLVNSFLENTGRGIGIGGSGVQIFCPLDPTRILMLFDPVVYRIKKDKVFRVKCSSEDTRQLNLLQVLHSRECLYFGRHISETYVRTLSEEAARLRPACGASTEEFRRADGARLIHHTMPAVRAGLSLSFCSIKREFRKLSIEERAEMRLRPGLRRVDPFPDLSAEATGIYVKHEPRVTRHRSKIDDRH